MATRDVFESFCAFGAGKDDEALMDNTKFAKLTCDLKLLDKKLTATDVDIIFNKPEVKSKTERKINFDQFQIALKLMAEKKYPGDADAVNKLEQEILQGKAPAVEGRERRSETSKYAGGRKERFDESGKGK